MHSAFVVHCGMGNVVSTISQKHFDLVPGSASAGPEQSSSSACCRQVVHALTSKKPSLFASWQVAVMFDTGTSTSPLLEMSPQTSASCWVPVPAPGGMTLTEQSSFVELSGLAPI